jgi:hypothetical protein
MIRYEFIGWKRVEAENADKVWGIICLSEPDSDQWDSDSCSYVSFWGRRGKKLQTKVFTDSPYSMRRMHDKKEQDGYRSIDSTKLNDVYPEFEKDLSKTAFWATFKI